MDGLSEQKRDLVDRIFLQLVTPSGSKIAHTPADLAVYANSSPEDVEAALRPLAGDARIVRAVATPGRPDEVRYEIYHDKLAAAVLDWRRRRQLRAAEARARAARVWLPVALYLFAVAALTVIASVVALATTDTGAQVGNFFAVVVPAAFGIATAGVAAYVLWKRRRRR